MPFQGPDTEICYKDTFFPIWKFSGIRRLFREQRMKAYPCLIIEHSSLLMHCLCPLHACALPCTVLNKHWQILTACHAFRMCPLSIISLSRQAQYTRLSYHFSGFKPFLKIFCHLDWTCVIPGSHWQHIYLSTVSCIFYIHTWLIHYKLIIPPHFIACGIFLLPIMVYFPFLCQTPVHLLDFSSQAGFSEKPSLIFSSPRVQQSVPLGKHIAHDAWRGQFLSSPQLTLKLQNSDPGFITTESTEAIHSRDSQQNVWWNKLLS